MSVRQKIIYDIAYTKKILFSYLLQKKKKNCKSVP